MRHLQRLALIVCALACPALAWAQGGVPASPIYFSGPTGRPLAGATITVCQSTGTGFPCSPLASIFTNAGLSITSPNPVTTDGNGNIPVIFAAPGVYVLSVTGSGITPTLVTATVAGTGGGNVVLSGNNVFSGQFSATNPCAIDGLIWVSAGGCYTTVQAAVNALPGGTTGGGDVYIPCGTWVGPTTLASGVGLIGICPGRSVGITFAHVTLTYTSNLVLSGLANVRMENLTLDFGQLGFGLQLNNVTESQFHYLSLNQCGSPTVDCISMFSDTSSTFKTTWNTFDHLEILANNATFAKSCVKLLGSGAVNSGPSTTQNRFYDVKCRGIMLGGIDSELNSDTNFFYTFSEVQEGIPPANSYLLGFNLLTPGSNQDADAAFYWGMNYTGASSPTSMIRSGATTGNWIQITAYQGNPPSTTFLGPVANTTWTLQTVPLNNSASVFAVGNGQIAACYQTSGCPSATSAAGDLTAARSNTFGAVQLGLDGGNIFRTGNEIITLCNGGTSGCDWRTVEVLAPSSVAGQGALWPDATDSTLSYFEANLQTVFQRIPQTVVLHTAYTNATTTPSTIGDGTRNMTFKVAASRDYTISCEIGFQGSATTAGPKFNFIGPAAPTAVLLNVDGGTNATAYGSAVVLTIATSNTALGALGAGAVNFTAHVKGAVVNGANAGTVSVQAAANGAGTLTIQPGSYCTFQ